ncbi:marvel domain-containing protein [Bombardia bombarda]|uniref:Marvel domain-containing protein n=1 Tax=Bombardia bombarda TaxID=252184 RepID=A0AA39WIH5_9PEZI|nr:marvel domain-containing protein [Bombardia bombarda]
MELIPTLLRGLQLLWILLLTALIGNVIATNVSAAHSATAAINFSMFVIVLSWLAAIFGLAAAFVDRIAIPIGLLAADALATLFTFIAAVVLAAKLRVVNCANTHGQPADWIAYGSLDDTKRCREIQASTAFMWFLFATFAAGLFFAFMSFRRGGGSVRSGPTMSQVRV